MVDLADVARVPEVIHHLLRVIPHILFSLVADIIPKIWAGGELFSRLVFR
jgi:hypothetical protein